LYTSNNKNIYRGIILRIMNKLKVLIFVLLLAMSMGLFSSCGEPIEEIRATLKIIAGDDEILDVTIPLKLKEPTVLALFLEATMIYAINYTLNDNGDSVLTIEDYVDRTEGTIDYFWEYLKDGVLPDNTTGGKAKDDKIVDGMVITYVYATYDTSTAKK